MGVILGVLFSVLSFIVLAAANKSHHEETGVSGGGATTRRSGTRRRRRGRVLALGQGRGGSRAAIAYSRDGPRDP